MDTKRLNLLLADDDEDDCLFFKEALGELPGAAHLTIVHDGEQLIQLLTEKSTALPDVLFLDLNMPRKNGFECLSDMKADEKLKHIPVIVLSTYFESTVANLLYKNGAHYCIRKPAEFARLKEVIQQALALIAQGSECQPEKENFVLNSELKPTA